MKIKKILSEFRHCADRFEDARKEHELTDKELDVMGRPVWIAVEQSDAKGIEAQRKLARHFYELGRSTKTEGVTMRKWFDFPRQKCPHCGYEFTLRDEYLERARAPRDLADERSRHSLNKLNADILALCQKFEADSGEFIRHISNERSPKPPMPHGLISYTTRLVSIRVDCW